MKELSGILNIDKPQNMTSHDVVAILRRKLGIKRIGHTGTLDPMATGVLPVCIGRATRIIEYLDLDYKTYECIIEFGIETDTEDVWGEVQKSDIESAKEISICDIEEACKEYKGWISQVPPMYSALKVNGRKLYEYARNGETVDVKARDVYIDSITVNDFCICKGENPKASLTIKCGKGTYIRSLCRDIGKKLGCGAVMSGLRRTQTGVFSESESIGIEKIKEMEADAIEALFCSVDTPLVHLGKGIVKDNRVKWFLNGGRLKDFDVEVCAGPLERKMHAPVSESEKYRNKYCMYAGATEHDEPVFLGTAAFDFENNEYKADKIFAESDFLK